MRQLILKPTWSLASLGCLTGLLSGLFGIGGGLIVGPALVAAGFSLRQATATALAVVAPVALVGVLTEWVLFPEHLHGWVGLALAVGGQAGIYLGNGLLKKIPDQLLRLAFTLLLLYAASRHGLDWGEINETISSGPCTYSPLSYGAFVALGVIAGVSAALFGIGGGVVMVPGLVLGVGGFGLAEAMGTSLLAMVLTATQGTRLALRNGRVDTSMVCSLAPTALLAAGCGVWLRGSLEASPLLGQAFALFLLFAIFRLYRKPAH